MHYSPEVQRIFEDTVERLRTAGTDDRIVTVLSEMLAAGTMADGELLETVIVELGADDES